MDKKKSKHKIVISARDVVGTGGGTVALSTAREFVKQGHEVVIVVDYEIPISIDNVKVIVTPLGSFFKSLRLSGKVSSRVNHFVQVLLFSIFGRILVAKYERQGYISIDHNCEAFGGDIVVLHNVFIEQFKSDKRAPLKKVLQFFNPLFTFRLLRERIVFKSKKVLGVIAVSNQTLNESIPYLGKDKTTVAILNGVDTVRFNPLVNTSLGSHTYRFKNSGETVLLFVGHEFERKRLAPVIESLSYLPDNYILWVLGGRANNLASYNALCQKLNLTNRVKFWGTVSDVEKYFQEAGVFILASDYEASPLVVLEAMASGIPALVTPVGSALQIIKEGLNGYIISASPKSIADKVAAVFMSNSNYMLMRVSARETAEEYSWKSVADKYLEVVEKVSNWKMLNGK